MKICTKCGFEKDESEFYVRRKNKLHSWCKICLKVLGRSDGHKLAAQKYQKTPHGKQAQKRYMQSEKGEHTNNKYRQSMKSKETQRRYYQSEHGKSIVLSSIHKYRKTPRGRLNAQQYVRRRNERKHNLDMQFTHEDAKLVYERFGHKCFNCGLKNCLEIDHHYPLSRGYGLTINNAVLLCRSCNRRKGRKMPQDFYVLAKLEELSVKLN